MDKRNFIEKIDTKMGEMSVKYVTQSGIACTKEEEKVIDAFRRVVKKWNKGSDDLYIMMGPNYLHFLKKSAIQDPNAWVDENAVVAEEFICNIDFGDS